MLKNKKIILTNSKFAIIINISLQHDYIYLKRNNQGGKFENKKRAYRGRNKNKNSAC